MDLVLAAVLGVLATQIIGPLMVAFTEVKANDRQIAQRDEDLEEWIVVRHRQLKLRWNELGEQARQAGVRGGATPQGRVATQTLLLYDYREELRQARSFVRGIEAGERWPHRLARLARRRPFPRLRTPDRAERLVDFWNEGTARNALTWGLDDIIGELPARTRSRALAEWDPS